MKPLFHPSLIALDNQIEDFVRQQKQGLPVHPSSGKQGVDGERATGNKSGDASAKTTHPKRVDVTAPVDSGHKSRAMTSPSDSLWTRSHLRFYFPDQFPAEETESEADRKFIESLEKIRAANRRYKKPPKRFGWRVLGMLLLAFILAMVCAYLGLNGGEW
jgi:hypothetical protein